jgi:hypothetical protein
MKHAGAMDIQNLLTLGKNPRKAQSENLQFFGLEKIRQFVYPHSSFTCFTRGRVLHFTPFIVDFSYEKDLLRNKILEEYGFVVSLIIYFSKTGPNPMALRITSY